MLNNKLFQRWKLLQSNYTENQKLIQTEFDLIKRRYTESHRRYHTLSHLEHLFEEIELLQPLTESIQWAVWYHDLIYFPGNHKNEKESAQAARVTMQKMGCSEGQITQVMKMILATATHAVKTNDQQTAVFLDADMSILGSEHKSYFDYTILIAQEYSSIPKLLYNKGRIQFIESTLQRASIFSTDAFRQKYETQARQNLTKELACLTGRKFRHG